MPFDEDFAKGREAEKRVLNAFVQPGMMAEWVNAKDAKHGAKRDIEVTCNHIRERIEVKNEDNKKDTGNICIEVSQGSGQHRRASGLRISEANVCVHTLGDKCVAYRVCHMRNYLQRMLADGFLKARHFGDNNNSGYVVPRVWLHGKDWVSECRFENLSKCPVFDFNKVTAGAA